MTTEQMIEEANKIVDSYNPTGDSYLTFRASKGYIEMFENGEWGAGELFQENIAKLFNLIATKSAEESFLAGYNEYPKRLEKLMKELSQPKDL